MVTDRKICGNLWGCSSVGRAPALQAGGQEFESLHLHVIMSRAAEPDGSGTVRRFICGSVDETAGADIRRISVNEKSEAFRVLRCESSEKQISLLFIMKYVP